MTAADFAQRLSARRSGKGHWQGKCPAHKDKKASLAISEGNDGKVLLYCHAGCPLDAVLAAVGLTERDLFPTSNRHATKKTAERKGFRTLDAAVVFMERALNMKEKRRDIYRKQNRKEHFVIVRFENDKRDKDFRPFHQNSTGWQIKDPTSKLSLFNLPEVIAHKNKPLVIVEGERCATEWSTLDILATTSAHGAKAAEKTDWTPLAGRSDVFIQPDNDSSGYDYAEKVNALLGELSPPASARFLILPDLPSSGDVVQWLQRRDAQDPDDIRAQVFALMKDAPTALPKTDFYSLSNKADEPIAIQNEVRGKLLAVLLKDKMKLAERGIRAEQIIVDALNKLGRFFFHAQRNDFATAMFFNSARKRLERIHSDSFVSWLSEWTQIGRAHSLFDFIFKRVEVAALSGATTTGIIPEKFWASRSDAIYLSNGDASIVKVTANNVTLVPNGTDDVLFQVGDTLAPWSLVEPRDPFAACSIFSDANYAAPYGKTLTKIWAMSMPTNPACKPPVCYAAPWGSGKTRTAKGVAELYGIPINISKVEEYGENSFWVNLDAGGLLTLDNADTKIEWLADAVAAAATDGCSSRRRLYTDNERITLHAHAWLAITTANPLFASDVGLADRLLPVRMKRRESETDDSKLTVEIKQHRDAGLSFIAHALSGALADSKPTPSNLNLRHPDFAAFAVRIGRTIGKENEVIDALRKVENDKSLFCVQNDFIGSAVLDYISATGAFEGTAADLRDKLVEHDPDLEKKPPSAKRIGKKINTLWPHLEKTLVATKETDRKNFTIYSLQPHANA